MLPCMGSGSWYVWRRHVCYFSEGDREGSEYYRFAYPGPEFLDSITSTLNTLKLLFNADFTFAE